MTTDRCVCGWLGWQCCLKMKILSDNPDTLQGAIATATKEQNLRTRANLSSHYHSPYKSERKEEPMELIIIDNNASYKTIRNIRMGWGWQGLRWPLIHVYKTVV